MKTIIIVGLLAVIAFQNWPRPHHIYHGAFDNQGNYCTYDENGMRAPHTGCWVPVIKPIMEIPAQD